MRIKNSLLIIGLLLIGDFASAQLRQVGEALTDSFPQVSFTVELRDPEERQKSYFSLEENGEKVDFHMAKLAQKEPLKGRDILILWEYMDQSQRKEQNEFLQQLLLNSLPTLLEEGDRINIATFAWTKKNTGELVYPLLPELGTDTAKLRSLVSEAEPPGGKNVNTDHGSELYPAISKGIATLGAADRDAAKVLVVLSQEFNNMYNSTKDLSTLIGEARQADVAVYSFRYKVKNDKYSLRDLATGSYGLPRTLDKNSLEASETQLVQTLQLAATRALGRQYSFQFTSSDPKDGKVHQVQLSTKSQLEGLTIPFNTPDKSFGDWFSENILLVVIVGLVFMLAVILLILFIKKRQRQQAKEEQLRKTEIDRLASEGKVAQEQLEEQKNELKRIRQEEQSKQDTLRKEQEREAADAERAQLLKVMYANGKTPRLVIDLFGKSETVELPDPVVIVGRDPEASIQIDHPTVSRSHFQIIFSDGHYKIVDLGSTNGTLLNGERMEGPQILQRGDIVSVGDAKLQFFT